MHTVKMLWKRVEVLWMAGLLLGILEDWKLGRLPEIWIGCNQAWKNVSNPTK
jgi:hypothetical protein